MDTDMENKNNVIAAVSSYHQKYYFNPDYLALPNEIRQKIKSICVLFVEEFGGNLSLELDKNEKLIFKTSALDSDFYYDEIGAGLKIKEIGKNYAKLLLQIQTYAVYKKKLK